MLREPPHSDVSLTWATAVAFLACSHFWTTDNGRGVIPGPRRSMARWCEVVSVDEKTFCIWFGIQGPRVRIKSREAQVGMSSTGVSPLRFIKSKVSAAIYQIILENFILPSADDGDFKFEQDFPTLVFDWQGTWSDLTTPDPPMQLSQMQLSKHTGIPLHLSSATIWLPPCYAAVFQ